MRKCVSLHKLASQEGLEPPTPNLEGSCSIRMSYWLSAEKILTRFVGQEACVAGTNNKGLSVFTR